jgi:hypothetical protein
MNKSLILVNLHETAKAGHKFLAVCIFVNDNDTLRDIYNLFEYLSDKEIVKSAKRKVKVFEIENTV